MSENKKVQRIMLDFKYASCIKSTIEAYLLAKEVENLSKHTIEFYRQKLVRFASFCEMQAVEEVDQIDANLIRTFMNLLREKGHKEGGIHAYYRALKAFIYWWDIEEEPENWRNPFRKVKAPKLKNEPLEPVETATIKSLLVTCDGTFTGRRDQSIITTLTETGCRANELIMMNLEDLDLVQGSIEIRFGKGGKYRKVGLGRMARRSIRGWLRMRGVKSGPLFVQAIYKDDLLRLSYDGLRSIVRVRAKLAGVEPPPLHGFRRTFALTMLRNGVDIFTLQRLMGHATILTLRRYLAQTDHDLLVAHRKASPLDKMLSS